MELGKDSFSYQPSLDTQSQPLPNTPPIEAGKTPSQADNVVLTETNESEALPENVILEEFSEPQKISDFVELSEEEKKGSLTKAMMEKLCEAYNRTLPPGSKPLNPDKNELPPKGYTLKYDFQTDNFGQIKFEPLKAKNGEVFMKTTVTVNLEVIGENGTKQKLSFNYPAAVRIRFPSPNASLREQEVAFRKAHMAMLVFADGIKQELNCPKNSTRIAELYNNSTAQIKFKFSKEPANFYGRMKRLSFKENFKLSMYPEKCAVIGGRLNGKKIDLSKSGISIRSQVWPRPFTSELTVNRNQFRENINTDILQTEYTNPTVNTKININQMITQLRDPKLSANERENIEAILKGIQTDVAFQKAMSSKFPANALMSISDIVEANLKDTADLIQDLDTDLPKGLLENALDKLIDFKSVGKLVDSIADKRSRISELTAKKNELLNKQSTADIDSPDSIINYGLDKNELDAISLLEKKIRDLKISVNKNIATFQEIQQKLLRNSDELEKVLKSTDCLLQIFKDNLALGGTEKEKEYMAKLEKLQKQYGPLIEKRLTYYQDEVNDYVGKIDKKSPGILKPFSQSEILNEPNIPEPSKPVTANEIIGILSDTSISEDTVLADPQLQKIDEWCKKHGYNLNVGSGNTLGAIKEELFKRLITEDFKGEISLIGNTDRIQVFKFLANPMEKLPVIKGVLYNSVYLAIYFPNLKSMKLEKLNNIISPKEILELVSKLKHLEIVDISNSNLPFTYQDILNIKSANQNIHILPNNLFEDLQQKIANGVIDPKSLVDFSK